MSVFSHCWTQASFLTAPTGHTVRRCLGRKQMACQLGHLRSMAQGLFTEGQAGGREATKGGVVPSPGHSWAPLPLGWRDKRASSSQHLGTEGRGERTVWKELWPSAEGSGHSPWPRTGEVGGHRPNPTLLCPPGHWLSTVGSCRAREPFD